MKKVLFFLFVIVSLVGCYNANNEVDVHKRINFYMRHRVKIDSTKDERLLFDQRYGKKSKVHYYYDGSLVFLIHAVGADYCVCYVDSATVPAFRNAIKEVRKKYCEWEEVAKKNNVEYIHKDFEIDFPNVTIAWKEEEEEKAHFKDEQKLKPEFVIRESKSGVSFFDLLERTEEDVIFFSSHIYPEFGFNSISDFDRFERLISVEAVDSFRNEINEEERKKKETYDLFK